MAEREVILTVAPTGGMADETVPPHLSTQPEEIADDVGACAAAGAAVVAVHARRPDDQATCDPGLYRQISTAIRERCDIVIDNSTGGGISGDMITELPGRKEISFDQRICGTEGGAEMRTFDPRMQYMRRGDLEVLMDTSWSKCVRLAEAMQERGIEPEWEIMSLPDLVLLNRLIEAGYDEATYSRRGEPANDLQRVERMVWILDELGLEPATPTEARQMLRLKPLTAAG